MAVNFLRTLVVVQSLRSTGESVANEVSLDIVPQNHPYLSVMELQIESSAILNRFIAFLGNTHLFHCTATFVSAVLNSAHSIVKTRPQFAFTCIETFLKWGKNKPVHFTALDTKNVQRNLKIILLSCYGYLFINF